MGDNSPCVFYLHSATSCVSLAKLPSLSDQPFPCYQVGPVVPTLTFQLDGSEDSVIGLWAHSVPGTA